MLGIAGSALERGRADREPRAGTFLPALTASLAYDHGDLVLRAPTVLHGRRTVEDGGRHRRDQLIIG